MALNQVEMAAARGMVASGLPQQVVAALFQVNSGRIAEAKGKGENALDVEVRDGHPVLSLDLVDILCASAAARHTILHGVFVFEPDVCSKLVDKRHGRNDGNRKLKWAKIKGEFSPDMERGGWLLNGETIKLSDAGTMVDGQNRCVACTRAKKDFKSLVVFGVPRAYFHTVDVGKPRSSADLFVNQGVTNAHVASGAVRWIIILLGDTPHINSSFAPTHILEYYNREIDGDALQESIAIARQTHVKARRDISHNLLSGLHYVLALSDKVKANRFFQGWAQGDPWFQNLNLRLNDLTLRYGGKPRPVHVTSGTVLQAWSIWQHGWKLRGTGKNSLTYERGPFEQWM